MAKSEMAKNILLQMQNIFDIWYGKTWGPFCNVLNKAGGYSNGRKLEKKHICEQIFFASTRFAIIEKNHFRDRKWKTILLT